MWGYIAVFVITTIASYLLRPKPDQQKPHAGTITAPTSAQGREIPVLFGTRDIDGPNTVWYGDLRVKPIKKKGGKK